MFASFFIEVFAGQPSFCGLKPLSAIDALSVRDSLGLVRLLSKSLPCHTRVDLTEAVGGASVRSTLIAGKAKKTGLDCVTIRMDYKDFLNADQWAIFRDVIIQHYHGRCQYCGDPGTEVHHRTYRHGLFNPRTVTLLRRPCHEIHLGRHPHHVPDNHPEKKKMVRIAEIARALGMDRALRTDKLPR